MLLINYFINLDRFNVALGGVLFSLFRFWLKETGKSVTLGHRIAELGFVFTVLFLFYPWCMQYGIYYEHMLIIAAVIGWAGYEAIMDLLDRLFEMFANRYINKLENDRTRFNYMNEVNDKDEPKKE